MVERVNGITLTGLLGLIYALKIIARDACGSIYGLL